MSMPSVDGVGCGCGGIHPPDAPSDERYPYDDDRHHHHHQPNTEIVAVPLGSSITRTSRRTIKMVVSVVFS
jgi:hypothetical protein